MWCKLSFLSKNSKRRAFYLKVLIKDKALIKSVWIFRSIITKYAEFTPFYYDFRRLTFRFIFNNLGISQMKYYSYFSRYSVSRAKFMSFLGSFRPSCGLSLHKNWKYLKIVKNYINLMATIIPAIEAGAAAGTFVGGPAGTVIGAIVGGTVGTGLAIYGLYSLFR